MRQLSLIVFTLCAFSCWCFAQNKVEWDYSAKRIGDKLFEVHITAIIADPWHIYSQQNSKNGIASPTNVTFFNNPSIVIEGKIREEGDLITKYDPILGENLKYYKGVVDFVQQVRVVVSNSRVNISGNIEYMVCSDECCLPPINVNFSVFLE